MSLKVEARLLTQARKGDHEAFQVLQIYVETRLRNFVLRLIGSHPHGDDIVQDVFIALYQNLERLDPVEKLYPFLFRVARNRCYDILRKQGRYEVVPIEAYENRLPAATYTQPDEQTHIAWHSERRHAR